MSAWSKSRCVFGGERRLCESDWVTKHFAVEKAMIQWEDNTNDAQWAVGWRGRGRQFLGEL
jgi:hypothetical protein